MQRRLQYSNVTDFTSGQANIGAESLLGNCGNERYRIPYLRYLTAAADSQTFGAYSTAGLHKVKHWEASGTCTRKVTNFLTLEEVLFSIPLLFLQFGMGLCGN